MADMHVLIGNGRQWRVAMHFAVPAGNNTAGVSWSDALANSELGGATVLPDGDGTGGTVSAAEKTSIESGTILEYVVVLPIESGGSSPVNIRDSLREFYAVEKADMLACLASQLRYFGAIESEV